MGSTPVAATAIGLGMDVQRFKADTAEARATLRATTQSFERDLKSAKTASEGLGPSLRGTFDLATKKVDGLGNALKGAQPAIAATHQSLQLLGTQGTPAVNALAGAVSSLAMGGFTPLGIAIAAVTAGVSLFAASQNEVAEATETSTEALSKQSDTAKRLGDDLRKLATERRAQVEGKTEDLVDLEREADALRHEIDTRETYMRPLGTGSSAASRIDLARRQAEYEKEMAALRVRLSELDARVATQRFIDIERRGMVDPDVAAQAARDRKSQEEQDDLEARSFFLRQAAEDERRLREMLGESADPFSGPAQRKSFDEMMQAEQKRQAEQAKAFLKGQADLEDMPGGSSYWGPSDTQQAEYERTIKAREDAQEDLVDATRHAEFVVAQTHRTGTEQAVEAYRERYAKILEKAREYGHDVTELEASIEEGVARIRDRGSLSSGFRDRLSETADEISRVDRVGSDMAERLTSGFGDDLLGATCIPKAELIRPVSPATSCCRR